MHRFPGIISPPSVEEVVEVRLVLKALRPAIPLKARKSSVIFFCRLKLTDNFVQKTYLGIFGILIQQLIY